MKSRQRQDHVRNLKAIFDQLINSGMRLNPTKCVFGVTVTKFLGYIVSQRGIESNPDKILAILNITLPTTKHNLQSLTVKMASLS